MKTETEKITVIIERKEALSIYNALLKAELSGCEKPDEKGASDLKLLLQSNFFSSMTGIHTL